MGITAGTAAAISAGVGAASTLYGAYSSAQAAEANRNAIAEQNRATAAAQNAAFTARNQAADIQTGQQFDASQQILKERNEAAQTMRTGQMSALKSYQDTLAAENQQADTLRQTGDTAAQTLLQSTSQPALTAAQTQQQQAAADLLNPALPKGPGPTDPSGNDAAARDPAYGGALARRTAEAATNIRTYGSKIGAVQAYGAPLQQVNLAIQGNRAGIMPAQTAEQLLRAGSATRLLPSQVGYQAATGTGQAQDVLAQSRGQGALEAAGLTYGNKVDIANLEQSDADTQAKNIAAQKEADAAYAASQAQLYAGIGKLGAYGAGYLGVGGSGGADWAPGANGIYTNLTTGATTDVPGVTMPAGARTLSDVLFNRGNIA